MIILKYEYYITGMDLRHILHLMMKDDLLWIAETLGVKGIKSKTKKVMGETLAEYLITHPQEVLTHVPSSELKMLKELVTVGPNTAIARVTPKRFFEIQKLGLVCTYQDKKHKQDFMVMFDELREAYAPYLDQAMERAKTEESAAKDIKDKEDAEYVEICKRMSKKYAVSEILKGLDFLHTQYVHDWFVEKFIENYDRFKHHEEEEIDEYLWCYTSLMEEGTDGEVEDCNWYLTHIMEGWRLRDKELYIKAFIYIDMWAKHEFADMPPTLKKDIDQVWVIPKDWDEGDVLFKALLPFPIKIQHMIEEGKFAEAAGNILYLYRRLAELYERDDALFENRNDIIPNIMVYCGFLLYLWCCIRESDKVSPDFKNDMAFFIILLQKEMGFFDECSSDWDDMFRDDAAEENKGYWEAYLRDLERYGIISKE